MASSWWTEQRLASAKLNLADLERTYKEIALGGLREPPLIYRWNPWVDDGSEPPPVECIIGKEKDPPVVKAKYGRMIQFPKEGE